MFNKLKNRYPIKFCLLFIIITLVTGCRQEDTRQPMKFKGYKNNPVLVPGESGSWDDLYVINAFVLEDKDTIYLFYTAYSQSGSRALGLATSLDGYHFTKFEGNPVLTGDKMGYDAFGVAQAQVLKTDSGWLLYFNGREIAGFSSGPSIGMATAKSLKGPWVKSEEPVITAGRIGDWDADFIYLGPVLKMEDGRYIMYYTGGNDILVEKDFYIGMATSKDGKTWKKHNDPATTQQPFANSDPVLSPGNPRDWDADIVLICDVLKSDGGFGMYYCCRGIGYATSQDGIHWKKYSKNPVYRWEDDPYFDKVTVTEAMIQGAKFLLRDSLCFMYYDYGHAEYNAISLAIAPVNKANRYK